MTVQEARELRICRICGKPIIMTGTPQGAELNFRRMIWPVKLTFEFGNEFAHTDCLESAVARSPVSE